MALIETLISALLFACVAAQMPIQGFFNVPATAFNRGGRVDFAGLSLGQVCKQIMMMGGKEALSDGMGMAAKWFSNQRINGQVAGGNDPQMQCLYSQATGGMMPGAIGARDPGNMFGDYYDTVIEYPMILDPCTAPQCDGKVNPTVLLMQAFAPMMRMRGMGGMGGMGGGMGGGMPGTNPFAGMAQNPLMSALMPQQNTAPAVQAPAANATAPAAPVPANPVVSNAAAPPAQAPQGNPLSSMLQNPQMQQMMQQLMMQMFMGNNKPAASPNPAASGFSGFPFGNFGFPGSMFV
ncbi:hypothetical protein BsWGS_17171 [Bradybaena similaris]